MWNAYREGIDTALATPATTLPGLAAKARIADNYLRIARPDGRVRNPKDGAEELLWSIMEDLLRLPK